MSVCVEFSDHYWFSGSQDMGVLASDSFYDLPPQVSNSVFPLSEMFSTGFSQDISLCIVPMFPHSVLKFPICHANIFTLRILLAVGLDASSFFFIKFWAVCLWVSYKWLSINAITDNHILSVYRLNKANKKDWGKKTRICEHTLNWI